MVNRLQDNEITVDKRSLQTMDRFTRYITFKRMATCLEKDYFIVANIIKISLAAIQRLQTAAPKPTAHQYKSKRRKGRCHEYSKVNHLIRLHYSY